MECFLIGMFQIWCWIQIKLLILPPYCRPLLTLYLRDSLMIWGGRELALSLVDLYPQEQHFVEFSKLQWKKGCRNLILLLENFQSVNLEALVVLMWCMYTFSVFGFNFPFPSQHSTCTLKH